MIYYLRFLRVHHDEYRGKERITIRLFNRRTSGNQLKQTEGYKLQSNVDKYLYLYEL